MVDIWLNGWDDIYILTIMNILAATYSNIWPFQTTVSVFFQQGAHVIKAPIGSGKSFLFFDGVVYGLYKYSQRAMLNVNQKQGVIKIIVQIHDWFYLIVRTLTKTAAKESCKTRMYQLNCDIDQVDSFEAKLQENLQNVVSQGRDIQTICKDGGLIGEEIVFKNETDIQQQITSLLPPREVFLSTYLLMQDSQNVFEATPAERIQVFKHVFGLLDLDVYKEELAEAKRQTTTELKIRSDDSWYLKEFQKVLDVWIQTTKELIDSEVFPFSLDSLKSHLEAIIIVQDRLHIQDFQIEEDRKQQLSQMQNFFEQKFQELGSLDASLAAFQEQLTQIDRQILQCKTSAQQESLQLEKLKKQQELYNPEQFQQVLSQKNLLLIDQEALFWTLKLDEFLKFGYKPSTLLQAYQILQELKQQWKECDAQIKQTELQIQTLIEKEKNIQKQLKDSDINNKESQAYAQFVQQSLRHKKHLQELLASYKQQMDLRSQQGNVVTSQFDAAKLELEQAKHALDTQSRFHCDKINGDCPFLETLNQSSLRLARDTLARAQARYDQCLAAVESQNSQKTYGAIELQYSEVNTQLELLEKNPQRVLVEFVAEREQKYRQLQASYKEENIQEKTMMLEWQVKVLDEKQEKLKQTLIDLERKSVEDAYQKWESLENERQKLEKVVASLETMRQQQHDNSLQILKLDQNQQMYNNRVQELNQQRKSIQEQADRIRTQRSDPLFTKLQYLQKLHSQAMNMLAQLQSISEQFRDGQLQIKMLQQREQMLSTLTTVFAKELLLLVLEDSLPTLSEIMNNFLAKVVDFQVRFDIIKTNSEKLELDATVVDQRGVRQVSSLSGGQKTILKLVRILSIATYMRSKFLFLDETINNIDQEVIWRVAQLLQDIVKSQNYKLYTVTHSSQIQQMDIRTSVVTLQEVVGF